MGVRSLIIWGVIGLVLVVLFSALQQAPGADRTSPQMAYSDLIARIDGGDVLSVTTQGDELIAQQRDGRLYVVYVPQGAMPDTVRRLLAAHVRVRAEHAPTGPSLVDIVLGLLPMLLLISAWYFFLRQMQRKGASSGSTGWQS